MDCTVDSLSWSFQWTSCPWVNKCSFNILIYYVEENLPELRVDFIITDDVQNLRFFFSKVPVKGSIKPSILLACLAPSYTHSCSNSNMSVQTNCAQCRAVGTLPISGFISEDTSALEATCHVAFAIAKGNRIQLGSDFSNSTMWIQSKREQKKKLKKMYLSTIQHERQIQRVRLGRSPWNLRR